VALILIGSLNLGELFAVHGQRLSTKTAFLFSKASDTYRAWLSCRVRMKTASTLESLNNSAGVCDR
jgi:hypothetical protein